MSSYYFIILGVGTGTCLKWTLEFTAGTFLLKNRITRSGLDKVIFFNKTSDWQAILSF